MNGPGHRLTGAVAGAWYASLTPGADWRQLLVSAAIASASSHGWGSPDVDLTSTWRLVSKVVPRLADGKPTAHRGITHWPGWPIIAWYSVAGWPAFEQQAVRLLLIGWASHVVADFVFGEVPLLLWRGHFGLKLDTGGWVERWLTALPLPACLAWLMFGRPDLFPLWQAAKDLWASR